LTRRTNPEYVPRATETPRFFDALTHDIGFVLLTALIASVGVGAGTVGILKKQLGVPLGLVAMAFAVPCVAAGVIGRAVMLRAVDIVGSMRGLTAAQRQWIMDLDHVTAGYRLFGALALALLCFVAGMVALSGGRRASARVALAST
jgi:hypothetical protein